MPMPMPAKSDGRGRAKGRPASAAAAAIGPRTASLSHAGRGLPPLPPLPPPLMPMRREEARWAAGQPCQQCYPCRQATGRRTPGRGNDRGAGRRWEVGGRRPRPWPRTLGGLAEGKGKRAGVGRLAGAAGWRHVGRGGGAAVGPDRQVRPSTRAPWAARRGRGGGRAGQAGPLPPPPPSEARLHAVPRTAAMNPYNAAQWGRRVVGVRV